ncbi:MAG: D-alanine--D-alanine ligase family protein [Candidatus Absconditabacterales bacterium]
MKKIGLFFGGMSNETEVSISSAMNVIKYIDTKKYDLTLIYRDKTGDFYHINSVDAHKQLQLENKIHAGDFKKIFEIALLMTHGKYGEDGILQGLLEYQRIPYCGCHVLSSALCMDKGMCKIFLTGHDIFQLPYMIIDLQRDTQNDISQKIHKIENSFVLPLYIKPSNSGSSIGITKIESYDDLPGAIKIAGKHDSKIIIEQGLIHPKEIEVAILGNKELIISEPGELLLNKDFFSYEDKYTPKQTRANIPANIPKIQQNKIKELSEKIYKLCDCSGFARIDFFIANDEIYFNEINTLPGFRDVGMFLMLINSIGISYKELLDKIIELAY